jgi:hypothetical protein
VYPPTREQLRKPRAGDEVADSRESVDVVDFVENHEGEDFPDAGDSAEQMNGYGIMVRNECVDLSFDREYLFVKGVHECDIHLDGGTDHGVGETVFDTAAIGAAVDALFERGQVVLGIGVLDVGLQLCMLTGKIQPAAEQVPG